MSLPEDEHSIGLLRWFGGKEYTCDARDTRDVGSIPKLEKTPGVGKLLKYSCIKFHGQRKPGVLQSMGSQRAGHNPLTEQ